MVKVFWLDTETTGLFHYKHDIIQLAWAIEINEKVLASGELLIQPPEGATIDPSALAVHGISESTIKSLPHQPPKIAYKALTEVLSNYVDKFDKADKYHLGGHNVNFDQEFLQSFFKKQGDTFFGSWFNYRKIDSMYLAWTAEYRQLIQVKDFKLVTLCELFNIEIKAHDAVSDLLASRELTKRLLELLKKDDR